MKNLIESPFKLDEITFEDIKKHMDDSYNLIYIDYNDSLDERVDLLQKCIETGTLDPLCESVEDWGEWESVLYIKSELKDKLQNEYDLRDEEVDYLMEKFDDDIVNYIYENDKSTPVKDLLSNTSKQVMFYDTGYEVESDSWNWSNARVRKERIIIKHILGIKSSKYDDRIDMMIRQASYGGQLVVYFYDDIEYYIPESTENDFTQIEFKDASIAIINVGNGSGDDTSLEGHSFSLPFKRENLIIDETIKYNYSFAVCGMCPDWCDNTIVNLSSEPYQKECEVKVSPIISHKDAEQKYKEVFKSGKCSAGDMDIHRHRNVIYINDFPCGNKCMDCGTFWVD